MTDEPNLVQGQPPERPEISAEGLETYREALRQYDRLLADPATAAHHRERAEALRQSVQNALAVTGQRLDPAPDGRTPAQAQFDSHFALSPNPALVEMCQRDSRGAEPPNPEQTAKALSATGLTHKEALDLAQQAVERTPQLAGVRPERLPAIALAMLARFGEHLRRHAPNRPQ